MEGATEENDTMENTTVEAPQLKRKEADEQLPQQPDGVNALETTTQISTPRSPENFMETLVEKGLNLYQGSSSDPGVMVEELTLNNYKKPSLIKGEGSSVKQGLWNNFARIAGELREAAKSRDILHIGDRENVGTLFVPQNYLKLSRSTKLEPNHSKVANHLVESDNRIALRSMASRLTNGVKTKVLPASGFPQFLVKNALREKEVAYSQHGAHKEPGFLSESQTCVARPSVEVELGVDLSSKPNVKDDDQDLVGGGGGQALDMQHDELSLRELLTPGSHKLDKFERMHTFKQILKLVNTSHSQGLILQNLRPSCFFLSPSNQIRYTGSFVSKSLMEHLSSINHDFDERISKRKYVWHDYENSSSKHHKLVESHKNQTIPGCLVSTPSLQESPSPSKALKCEGRWYASPEELNNHACSFASNIYSLGVLFFELFCFFDTREVHSAAMSDLRHRILPPSFLSQSPKEASFCLWLLHPQPSSRPNSRDILLSVMVNESENPSFPDQSLMVIDEEDAEADLLLHFLLNMKEEKDKHVAKLVADVDCLATDIEEVEKRYSPRMKSLFDLDGILNNSALLSSKNASGGPINVGGISRFSLSTANDERLVRNLDQLEKAYFFMRSKIELSEATPPIRSDLDVLKIRDRGSQVENKANERSEPTDSLGTFFEGLCKYARYSKFEVCGSMRGVDILNSTNVICSLSFDRDEDYFATAGVSKKIKIFEYSALLNDSVDIHYPLIEMSSRSKLSCVCWNNYIKNYLASTDYEGVVQLWDANTGQGFTKYTEHQKRAWSVDFCQVDPTRLASGSDDHSVKLWSINERNCISTIRNTANVCCVQFSPYSPHLLAFGSADYKIYCHDVRMTRSPWCILAGHGKTVSYVKFVDSATVVSASTDNSLKVWDLNKTCSSGLSTSACSLTLGGHTNEKNFVGLTVCDGYIACGSETNEVYAYYRTLPMPITTQKFGSMDPITGQETSDDNAQFVSSVCWRSRSNVVVAANSSGSIKLLRLV